jgi:hypothetical protein
MAAGEGVPHSRSLEAFVSGLKAYATQTALQGLRTVRQCMGGTPNFHVYSTKHKAGFVYTGPRTDAVWTILHIYVLA